jgi:hypothetical protein
MGISWLKPTLPSGYVKLRRLNRSVSEHLFTHRSHNKSCLRHALQVGNVRARPRLGLRRRMDQTRVYDKDRSVV